MPYRVRVPLSIVELERIAARGWQGTTQRQLGKWLLRAGAGLTGRANSVLPLGSPGLPLAPALSLAADRGAATMRAAADWGSRAGAALIYLQVDLANSAALDLYDGLGFTEHHRYHYLGVPR